MLTLSILPTPWKVVSELLLLLIAAILIEGFTRAPYDTTNMGRMRQRTKLPQAAVLVVLALIFWLFAARTTPLRTLGLLTFLGIAYGFLGELSSANVLGQKEHALYGFVNFSVGHILYMAGFREIAIALSLHTIAHYLVAGLAFWGVALAIWYLVVREPAENTTMHYASLFYALFLASMAGYATGLALHEMAFWPLAVGTILFLISDILVASKQYGGRQFKYMNDVIWATYITAQVLIVTAVPIAISLL